MRKTLTVKQRVRIWLAEQDLTQRALAQSWGMREARLSLLLSGKARPSLHELVHFEALGLTPRDFVR